LPHLSCWEKNLVILFHRISIIRRTCHERFVHTLRSSVVIDLAQ
jgi:hypothetical protein